MGYRPNPFATAFAAHLLNHRPVNYHAVVGLLSSPGEASGPWQTQYETAIETRAKELGFSVDFLTNSLTENGAAAFNRVVRARGIRALIVMPRADGATALPGADFSSLAAVTIDLTLRSPALHRASPDYFRGMQLALDTMRSRNLRRIAFCGNRAELWRIGRRWLGSYLAWQSMEAPEVRMDPYIGPGPTEPGLSWRSSRDDFERWLDRAKPDAIVSNCFYFQEWLQELGRTGPGGVSFASLGIESEKLGISGIDQQWGLIGTTAMDLVAGQIYRNEYGLSPHPTTVFVPPRWVDGNTCP